MIAFGEAAHGSCRAFGPARRALRGGCRVPGDKSISHRALILAALADGVSRLEGLSTGTDVVRTARALRLLGVKTSELAPAVRFSSRASARTAGDAGPGGLPGLRGWTAILESLGRESWSEPEAPLDLGNSGTGLRLLVGAVASSRVFAVFTGDESLRNRPMARVVGPLRAAGAEIWGREGGNLLPLAVRGGRLRGTTHRISLPSAQVVSALLLAGLGAEGQTEVFFPPGPRDHTLRLLRKAGARVDWAEGWARVEPGPVEPIAGWVPGDISSAAFLIGAALVVPGSEITVEGVGLNPSRREFLSVLAKMGAKIEWQVEGETLGEPWGRIRASHSPELEGFELRGELTASCIDEIPLLCVVATQARGRSVVLDASELRVKESDRLEALARGLSEIGARVALGRDWIAVEGPTRLAGGDVESFRDHRIAMAMAVAGLVSDQGVRVRGWEWVETSFPEFEETLAHLAGEAREGEDSGG